MKILLFLGGGLGIFLLGMQLLSAPLQSMAGTRLQAHLSNAARHPIQGLLSGAVATAILQSSSTLTVFLVGLTGAGTLSLNAAAVLLMGANVGTTLSPWLLGTLGLSQTPLLRPEYLLPALLALSLLLFLRNRKLGQELLGLILLLLGMTLMQHAAVYLPRLSSLSATPLHPLRGVLAGTVVTAILQSSAGAVGMLQALSEQLSLSSVIPLLIGLNLGTCVTALLASLGSGPNARRVAVIHISFNALGGLIWLTAMQIFPLRHTLCQPASPVSVAALHSLFNLSTTIILLPLRNYLVRLAVILVPEKPLHIPGH